MATEDEFEVDMSSEEYQLLIYYCTKRSKLHFPHKCDEPYGTQYTFQGLSTPGPLTLCNQRAQGPASPMDLNLKEEQIGLKDKKWKKKSGEADRGQDLTGVADRLTQIADSVQITEQHAGSNLVTDNPEEQEDVIQKLVELLRSSGDQLNEKIKKNKALQKQLQRSFSYTIFNWVTSILQRVVTGDQPGRAAGNEDRLQREQIAVVFEVASRLSEANLLPMNRAMGYGSRYIQLNHSPWVKQQGGWEKAFESENID